jgi:hypothetical protein
MNGDYSCAFNTFNSGFNSTLGGRYNVLSATDNGGGFFNGCGLFFWNDATQLSQSFASCSATQGGRYLCNSSTLYTLFQNVSKTSGSFIIDHPDPAKNGYMTLMHKFVESPNEGDTLYRYDICTNNCTASIELPDYFKFLNKNVQFLISPKNHFGRGYACINEEYTCVNFTSDSDGAYNILVMGTRKDEYATAAWKGVETIKKQNDSILGYRVM